MGNKNEDTKEQEDHKIMMWKLKRTINLLENCKGNGTSMISLIIRPGDQIPKHSNKLADEMGTATHIKSRVNRQSVVTAITKAQQKLKTFTKVPKTGLCIYCGTVMTPEGKEKNISYALEPPKPINTSLYRCDNKFMTDPLRELLTADDSFGFIVMDGNGSLFGTLCGQNRKVLQKISVDLPKKHGRGGQSAARFGRLRMEKRRNYIRKVAELATRHFITNDKPNVTGLFLAGSAEFKVKLGESDLFDKRLKAVVVGGPIDVSYGGENGFNQAIELAASALDNVKIVRERNLISRFMSEIARDTGKFCFGVKDTMNALDAAAIETLIVWEESPIHRIELENKVTKEKTAQYVNWDEKQSDKDLTFKDKEGVELDIRSNEPLVDYLADNYKSFGCKIEFVTDRSQIGAQFVKGFGGVGGIMRYVVDLAVFDGSDSDDEWI